MSPAAILGTALGTAAVTAGRGAAVAVGNGLSFAAQLLRAAGGPGVADSAVGSLSTSQPDDLFRRIDAFRERIRRQLAAAGIQLSQPVELHSDGLGAIAVAEDHPQQSAIEELLAGDYLLQRDFQQLAGDYAASGLPATLRIVVA